jgi:hypothetical protein
MPTNLQQQIGGEAEALISTIKAHITAGDKAAGKAEQHYIAAGQHLKTLKAGHAGSWVEWEALLKEKIGIGKSRASELMQIADGTKTAEGVASDRRERQRKAKAIAKPKLSVVDGENADDPEVSAETMKAKFADAAEEEARKQPATKVKVSKDGEKPDPAEIEDDDEDDLSAYKPLFLTHADQAAHYAVYSGPVDGEVLEAARLAARVWSELVQKLEEDCKKPANPPARGRKPKFEEMTLGDAVGKAFTDLADLAIECREVVDNAPPGISETQRIQTFDETANTLESLEEPDVSAELAKIKISLPIGRMPRSRGDRQGVALNIIAVCVEALDNIDENDPRLEEAASLRDELENASSEAENCEFPGMYG